MSGAQEHIAVFEEMLRLCMLVGDDCAFQYCKVDGMHDRDRLETLLLATSKLVTSASSASCICQLGLVSQPALAKWSPVVLPFVASSSFFH